MCRKSRPAPSALSCVRAATSAPGPTVPGTSSVYSQSSWGHLPFKVVVNQSKAPPQSTGPHKWAVGTTFEWEFEFPITTNPAYGPKSASKRKAKKSANPKAAPARAREASKPATVKAAKPKASEKPKRVRLTPEERQERTRARAAEKRSKLKEQGLCKDCRQPVIPDQTRCPDCAETHRQARRAQRK